MPGVSNEQIARAKGIDLLTYLQSHEPNELIRAGPNEYRTASHHSLVISNGMWHWINGNVGGKTALDYLTRVRGYSFVDAVTMLCNTSATQKTSFQHVKSHVITEKTPFKLPLKNNNNDRVIAYLRSRGIEGEIITWCIRRGILYESAKTRNCVFVGRDNQGEPRSACMRGTFNNYKQDVAGSIKRYGFCLSQMNDSPIVSAYESPVDVLSAVTLAIIKKDAWETRHYLSLGGTSPSALLQFLENHPEIEQVILSLDNDIAGRNGTQKIIEIINNNAALTGRILRIADYPPTNGKDCNEQLQHYLEEQKTKSDASRQKGGCFTIRKNDMRDL
jgi:hypothetical protein